MSKLRSRLSYANVTATIALFLALGGGALAAFKVPKKSVGTKQLKANAVKERKLADGAVTNPKLADGAVTNPKLADGAITGSKLADGAVANPKLPDGVVTDPKVAGGTLTAAKIAFGQVVKGVIAREAVCGNLGAGGFCAHNLQCASGEQAVGGGAGATNPGTRTYPPGDSFTRVLASAPINATGQATASGQVPTGWHITGQIASGGNKDIRVYVLCARR
jgi:hypothetical protein